MTAPAPTRAEEGREPILANDARRILASKIAHEKAYAKDGGFSHATILLTDDDAALLLAALRAQPERGAEEMKEAIQHLPDDLQQMGLASGVRTLAWAHGASHRTNARWGVALRLLLPFVHEAACYGMLLKDGTDESLTLDAEDICVGVAAALGCDLGDAGWEAMLSEGRSDIRALPLHPAKDEGEGR